MSHSAGSDAAVRRGVATFSERLVERIAGRTGPDRRGFLRGSAMVGAALAGAPWTFLTRPVTAYAAVCGPEATCKGGWSVFCCTINRGRNSCPPNSFIGGWWKADNSSFCGGAARYYIDCNAYRDDDAWSCHCHSDPRTCDHRRVACNQFRYGQCNPQIPLSSTGPVVCRVVSCTPPWKQWPGTCSASSTTDNRTRAHTAPCLAGSRPIGQLDDVTVDRDEVRLVGWALDRDEPSTSLRIAVSSDARSVGVFTTTVDRPDINDAYGVGGTHGFDVTVVLSGGRRTVRVNALNVGPGVTGNPEIGRATVDIPVDKLPVGRLDALTVKGTTLRLRGWTFDPDRAKKSLDVRLYVDGERAPQHKADQPRPDVNRAYHISGDHGFDFEADVPEGRRLIELYARNAGPGSRRSLLARRTIDVGKGGAKGGAPRGGVEHVAVDGERVVLEGWAYDPDQPTAEVQVAVHEDGELIGWFRSGLARPDVNRAHGITGNHGYRVWLDSLPGSHTWQVFAINAAGGPSNPVIGTRTGRIGDPGGVGRVDEVTLVGSTLRLRGWAVDQHRTSDEISVGVVVDGGPMTRHPTGIDVPEIHHTYGITGAHGFDLSRNLARGKHLIAVFAMASAGAALIHTEEVTV